MRQLPARPATASALALAGILSLILGGCGAVRMALSRRFDPPSVSVVDARVEAMTFAGADLAFDVEVGNPNAVGIDITGYDYHIDIAGERVVVGTSTERRPVDGESSSIWTVPASVEFASLLSSVASLATEHETTFSFECAVRLDVPFVGEVSVPVTRIGALPLPRPPSISFDGVSLKGVSAAAANLVLRLRVENPNAFLLRFESLTYALGLNGDTWVSASQDVGLELLAGAAAGAELPVRVALDSLGAAAASLVRDPGGLPLQLAGAMRLAAPLPQMPSAEATFELQAAGRR